MKNIVLIKEFVPEWLKRLIEDYEVFAPRREAGDEAITAFGRLDNPAEAAVTAGRTRNSAKSAVFPQVEELLAFDREGEFGEPGEAGKPILLFGVTPCDARALMCLDKPFLEEDPIDTYYSRRRERAVVVGLACNQPWRSCFCDVMGSGPFSTEGLDLQMVDLGDKLLLVPLSERGAEIAELAPETQEAGDTHLGQMEESKKQAEDSLGGYPGKDAVEAASEVDFDDPLWDRIHLACLGCGACTYDCPTCYCFDIVDEVRGEEGRRLRCWDTCQFLLFTLQASGYNPHPTGKERVRQRILHKFQFFPERFGESVACVGCGRCIEACPVNLDIREVISLLSKERPS